MFNLYRSLYSTLVPLTYLNNYFFFLNKWPIDKAPKVSNSSYLVGLGLVLLFHLYAYPVFDAFVFVSFYFFSLSVQVTTVILLLVLCLLGVRAPWYTANGIIFSGLAVIIVFIFFYYPSSLRSGVLYPHQLFLVPNYLILNYDFFLFLFFFLGWVFKLGKKYSLESLTKNELYLYRSIVPSIYFFEFFTFVYCVIWRYMNSTLVGYPTIMYLKFYQFHSVTSLIFIKSLWYLSILMGHYALLLSLKRGDSWDIVLFYYFFLLLYILVFLFKEFREFWVFMHQISPLNISKFTYFKFYLYLLFFNFLHAFLVVLFSIFFYILYFNKNLKYVDNYDVFYLIIKNFYFIMFLSLILFFSIYIIHEMGFLLNLSIYKNFAV